MAQPASQTQSSQAPGSASAQQQQQQQQQQNPQQNQLQRHLVVVVEATGALGPAWPAVRSEYVDKLVRAFCGQDGTVQAGTAEMALVAYGSHGSSSASLFQHSGWTSNPDVFLDWLGSIEFFGGGFGGAALTEGLAQALLMCCPEQSPPTTQSVQRHCLLVGASNPHALPTPVPHPPLNISTGSQPDHWWLADSEAVAKAFPQCQVSLSVICPRQLPSLKTLYQLAKQRTTDAVVDVARNSQHLALISENFVEASACFRRPSPVVSTITATSTTAPAASSIKAEQQPASASAGLPNPTVPATSGVAAPVVTAAVRTSIPLPTSTVKLEQTSALQRPSAPMASSTMLSNAPLSIPSTMPASANGQDALRPAALSPDGSAVTSSQDFKPVGSNSLQRPAVAASILNSVSHIRHAPGSLPLAAGSGGPLSVSNILSAGVGTGSLPVAQGSLPVGQGSLPIGQGSLGTPISVGGATGILHSLTGTAAGMMGQSTGTAASGSSGLIQGMVGLGQAAGNLAQNGLGISHALAGQGSANSGLSQLQTTGMSGLPGGGGIPQQQPVQTMGAASTPPQASGAKYTKLWQGVLAGQRQAKSVPICQLEGYRQSSSPETLANDWPQTMQILRLIPQDYMTNKEYQEKAELLVFKPLAVYKQSGHPITFLHQLAEKKLCAVIQLPSQTLLLASAADKPQRMIGMLFPGDMVVVKPQGGPQQQQQQGQVSMQQQVAQQQQQQSQQLMSSPQSGFM